MSRQITLSEEEMALIYRALTAQAHDQKEFMRITAHMNGPEMRKIQQTFYDELISAAGKFGPGRS